jgi:hypothetical protein
MSLFEQASLIVTPNAFKAGKLYSIKPTDGSGDLDVVRATTATRVNSAGLIESVANNVPRLDYTNGSCPSILVEPQRTNLFLRSEEFDNAYWGKAQGGDGEIPVVTANQGIAPNGTMTADRVVFNIPSTAIDSQSRLTAGSTSPTGQAISSVFLKSNTSSSYTMRFRFKTEISLITVTPEWQKLDISANNASIESFQINLRVNNATFGGTDNFADILIWGAQLEAGSNATSYIPTEATAVTRNADVISKTGISDLIGQTEGTVFADININLLSQPRPVIYLQDNSYFSNLIRIELTTGNNFRVTLSSNGNLFFDHITTYTFTTGRHKIAFTYSSINNKVILYANGIILYQTSLSIIPIFCQKINFGSRDINNSYDLFANHSYNSAALWKTALTDQECINLTTL